MRLTHRKIKFPLQGWGNPRDAQKIWKAPRQVIVAHVEGQTGRKVAEGVCIVKAAVHQARGIEYAGTSKVPWYRHIRLEVTWIQDKRGWRPRQPDISHTLYFSQPLWSSAS